MAAHLPIVVLSGAGLSAASGIPTFRAADGLWEGHRIDEVATPQAWRRDPAVVRAFYDARRLALARARPNPGHHALAELQQRLGPERVALVTQNVDGLLQEAGARDVVEMHGSLRRLRCEGDPRHPHVPIADAQDPGAACATCGRPLRPDIVWFGEIPDHLPRIDRLVTSCRTFVAVGTSGVVYPAAGLAAEARRHGASTLEVNPQPSGAPWFARVVAEPAEVALPALVASWLDG